MKVRDEEIVDNRSLLLKAADYKNSKVDFDPPNTLGKPKQGSKNEKECLAMDAAITNVLSGFQDELSYMAMPKFVGYAMLSNVAQEALIRAGVETIADEMTRRLVEFTYDEDDGAESDKKEKLIADIESQMAKFKVKEVLNDALIKDGNFGGCLIYIDVGDLDDEEAAEPLILDSKTFKKGSLRGFKVIEPINIYPAYYNTSDPTSKDYFKPTYWYVLGRKYHASRFIYIASNEPPLLLKPAYNFFGIPRAQLALDYVAQFVANRESAQELLNKFSLTCWKTNMGQVLQGASTSDLVKRAKLFNKMKHNSGVMLLDKDTEDMIQVNTPLGGVKDIVEMSLNLLTAVWRIPKIKYIGESEGGINGSSKEQMRSFYDFILSQKEKVLTNPFEILLKVFQLNLGYEINDALGFRFPPMVEMDEMERAQLNKMDADRDNIYIANGVLSQEEVRQRLSISKNSGYSMIDVDDLPEIPEEPLKEDEKDVANETDKQTAEDMAIDEEEPKDWITIKGNHVPVMEGESKKNAVKEFVNSKEKGNSSYSDGKTDREKEAIQHFTAKGSEQESLNKYTKEDEEIMNGLTKKDLKINKPIYRKIEIPEHKRVEIFERLYDGEKVPFKLSKLNSFSYSDQQIHNFSGNVILEIDPDSDGFKGVDISKDSVFPQEEEVLVNGEDCEVYIDSYDWDRLNNNIFKLKVKKKTVKEKTTNDMTLDEEEPKDWITVNGNHVPIMEGESKGKAVKNFVASKEDDEDDYRRENEEYNRLNDKRNSGMELSAEEKKRYNDLWYSTTVKHKLPKENKEEEPKKEDKKPNVSQKDIDEYKKELEEYERLSDKKQTHGELSPEEGKRLQDLWVTTLYKEHVLGLKKQMFTKDSKPSFLRKVMSFMKNGRK